MVKKDKILEAIRETNQLLEEIKSLLKELNNQIRNFRDEHKPESEVNG